MFTIISHEVPNLLNSLPEGSALDLAAAAASVRRDGFGQRIVRLSYFNGSHETVRVIP